MQALILAGGEGTRLRPITSTMPKPVVPLANRPHLELMISWLQGHGVDEIILSCGFLADGVRAVLGTESGWAFPSGTWRSLFRSAPGARCGSLGNCWTSGSSCSTATSSPTST